jgi:hypothetical protein
VVEGGRSKGGRQRRWNFNGAGYRRWKLERGGDRVWPFLKGKRGKRQCDSIVSEADDKVKSGATTGEVKGGDWHLEVEDDQRKLCRWVKCVVGLNY